MSALKGKGMCVAEAGNACYRAAIGYWIFREEETEVTESFKLLAQGHTQNRWQSWIEAVR